MRYKENSGEMEARRRLALDTAFRLFSERSIEEVKMSEIAEASGMGMATLYRYFGVKLRLITELGALKWREYAEEVEAQYTARNGRAMTACEEYDFFLGRFVDLYDRHPGLLRFIANFDQYVRHENARPEDMAAYYESVDYFTRKFTAIFLKNSRDHTLREEISQQELFLGSLYAMLSVAQKYAIGIIYPADGSFDCRDALRALKEILLSRARV